MKPIFSILCFFIAQNVIAQTLIQEKGRLTPEETKVIQVVQQYHRALKFPKEVTRHYAIKGGKKTLVKTTFNHPKKGMFYYQSFIYYKVELSPDNRTINYRYSSGRAFSSEGQIYLTGPTLASSKVVRNDFSYGTTAGTTTVWVNNKKVYEKNDRL